MGLRRKAEPQCASLFGFAGRLKVSAIFILAFFFFGFAGSSFAVDRSSDQRESRILLAQSDELSESEWEEITSGMNYGEREEEEKEDEEYQEPSSSEENENGNDSSGSDWSLDLDTGFIGSIILGIVILILVIILIYLIARHIKERDVKIEMKQQERISFEEIEENLPESDLERYLRLALEAGDLKGAIRVYYLMVIQQLSEKRLIEWQREKTNYEYLIEMRSTALFKPFSRVTLTYEFVWYGDAHVDENTYNALHPQFKDLLLSIENGKQ